MTKKRKTKAPAVKSPSAAVKVHKIVLPKDGVVRVVVPKGVAPVVAVRQQAIEIAPVKSAAKQTWWAYLFGRD